VLIRVTRILFEEIGGKWVIATGCVDYADAAFFIRTETQPRERSEQEKSEPFSLYCSFIESSTYVVVPPDVCSGQLSLLPPARWKISSILWATG